MNQLKKLIKHDLVIGLNNDIIFEKNKLCSACQANKQVGNTHPTKSIMHTSRLLELLHMDLFGTTTYRSIGGNSFVLVVVHDYSRYTWFFFLSDKSNVFSIFKGFSKRDEMNLISKSIRLEVIMTPSSRTLELKIIVMKRESNMNFQPSTLHNKLELLKGIIIL
jgi:hypothetical protein